MKTITVLLLGAACGALVTYTLTTGETAATGAPARIIRDEARPPPATEPAADEAPRPEPGADTEAERWKQKATTLRNSRMEMLRQLGGQIHERDARIRDLEREIELLKKTLPKPEMIQHLERVSIEQMKDIHQAMKDVAEVRLLAVPRTVTDEYAAFLQQEHTGAVRLLQRGAYEALMNKRGGGAYYSFVTRDHSYNEEPDLEFQREYFTSGFYGGNEGYFLDLGDVPIDNVSRDVRSPPPGLDDEGLKKWALLWSDPPEKVRRRTDFLKRTGLPDRIKAHAGHTYVLRSILEDEHDVLVVFKAVEHDQRGHTLVWRLLKDWQIPRRR